MGRLSITGVNSFDENGNIVQKAGTSFSTPRITSLTAELYNRLDEEFNPLLLKALTIHSAKYPENSTIPNLEKLKYYGYGIPSVVDDILFNDPYEITLILQDTLDSHNWLQIWDFPFPPEMNENGLLYGQIIATLVSSPILSDKQGAEYCQSNLDLKIGTYEGFRNRGNGRTILNPIGLTENQNLLDMSLYQAKFQKSYIGEFARERTLINMETNISL